MDDLSEREPEEIKQEIEATKAALSEKLEILESEVKDSVQEAKSKVRETVEEVKRAFDIRHQVSQHPWIAIGGAVLAGTIVGRWAAGSDARSLEARSDGELDREFGEPPSRAARADRLRSRARGVASRFADRFDDELTQLKGIAMGAAIGVIADLVRSSIPKSFSEKVGEKIESVAESASAKLGISRRPAASDVSASDTRRGWDRERTPRRGIDPTRTDVV